MYGDKKNKYSYSGTFGMGGGIAIVGSHGSSSGLGGFISGSTSAL